MTFHFTCQLDRATGCLGIWLNTILSVPLRMCLHETYVPMGRLSKADVDEPYPICWRPEQKQKAEWGRICSLCQTVLELGYRSSLVFRRGLELEFTPLALPVLGPWGLDWSHISSSPGSPACWLQTNICPQNRKGAGVAQVQERNINCYEKKQGQGGRMINFYEACPSAVLTTLWERGLNFALKVVGSLSKILSRKLKLYITLFKDHSRAHRW